MKQKRNYFSLVYISCIPALSNIVRPMHRYNILPSDRLSKRRLHFHWICDASNEFKRNYGSILRTIQANWERLIDDYCNAVELIVYSIVLSCFSAFYFVSHVLGFGRTEVFIIKPADGFRFIGSNGTLSHSYVFYPNPEGRATYTFAMQCLHMYTYRYT